MSSRVVPFINGVSKSSMAIAVPSSQGAFSKESANGSKSGAAVKQPPFTVDQQLKFLHLQAEAESLLQQLQLVKQQRELRQRSISKED